MASIEFDKKVKCGADFVALRMLDKCTNLKVGDIYIPQTFGENSRLGFYVIEDVGENAAKEYGLANGDYVLADRLASFAHTEPVAVMRYNNIICKTNATRSEFYPLKNMVFVDHDKNENITNVGGIYVSNYTEKLNVGTITAMNIDDSIKTVFNIGDRVMLVKGGDFIQLGDRKFTIYKYDELICKIID